jgi:hypothetical protein
MGSLEFFLFTLWLSYCALVFVCLMQALSYMLWMKEMVNDLIKVKSYLQSSLMAAPMHFFVLKYHS